MAEKKNINNVFLQFIATDCDYSFIAPRNIEDEDSIINVTGLTLDKDTIYFRYIHGVDFVSCKFENVTFNNTHFFGCSFLDCQFINCSVISTTFEVCYWTTLIFNSTFISKTKFLHSNLSDVIMTWTGVKNNFADLDDISFSNCHFSKIYFNNLTIARCHYGTFTWNSDVSLHFKKCEIYSCRFSKVSFGSILLEDVLLSDCTFLVCLLNADTLKKIKKPNSGSCLIDLQTILMSNLDEEDYKIFGVHGFDPKGYIKDLVTEMQFQSVFISYCFADKEFAIIINEQLRKHGVNTFLWERDAPGGLRLKKIMSDNIQKHDRLLFIASEHSLKSEACHYELNEARDKYKKEWKDIYYPIHIDNYLFEVRKEVIPRENRNEFWENIEEVKEYHSKDFIKFRVKGSYDLKDFEESVKLMVKDLKKKN